MRMLPLLLQLVLLPMMVVVCMRRAELTRRLGCPGAVAVADDDGAARRPNARHAQKVLRMRVAWLSVPVGLLSMLLP